jgi:hypothetical protein
VEAVLEVERFHGKSLQNKRRPVFPGDRALKSRKQVSIKCGEPNQSHNVCYRKRARLGKKDTDDEIKSEKKRRNHNKVRPEHGGLEDSVFPALFLLDRMIVPGGIAPHLDAYGM